VTSLRRRTPLLAAPLGCLEPEPPPEPVAPTAASFDPVVVHDSGAPHFPHLFDDRVVYELAPPPICNLCPPILYVFDPASGSTLEVSRAGSWVLVSTPQCSKARPI
jgi:hypothetical protein